MRVFDVVVALCAIAVLAPLFVAISLLLFIGEGGPVLYSQQRLGRDGRRFSCLKFRTMAPNAEASLAALLASDVAVRQEWLQNFKLRRDPRITPVGAFLRRWSLDELPQFLNVLRGEMSVVGPRPIVHAEVARYGRYFDAYCSVRPGITGLWQIMGRNDVSYRRRVAIDTVYTRTRCLRLDTKILLLTLPAVLGHKGCY